MKHEALKVFNKQDYVVIKDYLNEQTRNLLFNHTLLKRQVCRHVWKEVLYKVKNKKNKDSKNMKDYEVVETIPSSYKPKPRGQKRAGIAENTRSDGGAYSG